MKQFSLEEYLKNPNRKVVTRDGHPVRIICTDHDNISYPIVGAIKGYDFPFCFSEDGYVVGSKCNDANDLFFAPEKKEKKEKHEGWVNVYKGENRDYFTLGSMIYDRKEDAERCRIEETCVATVKIEWEDEQL